MRVGDKNRHLRGGAVSARRPDVGDAKLRARKRQARACRVSPSARKLLPNNGACAHRGHWINLDPAGVCVQAAVGNKREITAGHLKSGVKVGRPSQNRPAGRPRVNAVVGLRRLVLDEHPVAVEQGVAVQHGQGNRERQRGTNASGAVVVGDCAARDRCQSCRRCGRARGMHMQALSHRVNILFCCQLQGRRGVLRHRNGGQARQGQAGRAQSNARRADCQRRVGEA